MLARSKAIRRAKTVGLEPQRCGQHGELLGDQGAKRPERGLGLKPGTHRPHLGDAPEELVGEQPDDDAQNVMDQTHPALDPAHRPRELDRIAAQRIARRGQAQGLLGVGHHLFDLVQLPRKPCGQTLRQQTEGGVALRAVPASDPCPARALARVGAVACQRTAPVRVVRAPPDSGGRELPLSQTHAGAAKINRCHRRKTHEIITPSGTPDQHPSVAPLTRTWVASLGRSATFLDDPCVHAPLFDPGGPPAPGHFRTGDVVFRTLNNVDSAFAPFEARPRGLHALCVRFAAGVAPGPRNTRFRLVASLDRSGLSPAGSHRWFTVMSFRLHGVLHHQASPGAIEVGLGAGSRSENAGR